MPRIEDLTNLKNKIDWAKQEAARAAGALDQVMQRLREEHGCGTLDEAKALLAKLNRKEKKAGEEFDTALKEFNKEFGDLLNNIGEKE